MLSISRHQISFLYIIDGKPPKQEYNPQLISIYYVVLESWRCESSVDHLDEVYNKLLLKQLPAISNGSRSNTMILTNTQITQHRIIKRQETIAVSSQDIDHLNYH